ncbi:MAG: hypothetical protein GY820_27580 [Gammaproteobacteria bacterium]|nr:hypothetical protein [Gammaproteobacteria bacterium]
MHVPTRAGAQGRMRTVALTHTGRHASSRDHTRTHELTHTRPPPSQPHTRTKITVADETLVSAADKSRLCPWKALECKQLPEKRSHLFVVSGRAGLTKLLAVASASARFYLPPGKLTHVRKYVRQGTLIKYCRNRF